MMASDTTPHSVGCIWRIEGVDTRDFVESLANEGPEPGKKEVYRSVDFEDDLEVENGPG